MPKAKKTTVKKSVSKTTKKTSKKEAPIVSVTADIQNAVENITLKTEPVSVYEGGRDLQTIARQRRAKVLQTEEDVEAVQWLAEQARSLSDEIRMSDGPASEEEIIRDFDRTLTNRMFDKKSLEAIMTHSTIESLEAMYGDAQKELLKAKRKAMVLEKVVTRAHELLEQQALSFLD